MGAVVPTLTPDQILDGAADFLETERGAWCVGAYRKGRRGAPGKFSHCADGALRLVAGADPNEDTFSVPSTNSSSYWLAYDQLAATTRDGVEGFNDAQRDKRKVIRAMRRAAEAFRRGLRPALDSWGEADPYLGLK